MLEVLRTQLTLSDKTPFVWARGSGQTADAFEAIRIAHGLSEEAFRAAPRCKTVINTNAPRPLDKPMTQGLIDFAAAGQVCVVTPFCLSGAMAPVTVVGALTLSHAEALAGIALTQIVNPGAPVVSGAFSSNVDMKSGAPVFGTPEHIKTNFGAGELARHLGLPWRSAAGTAANVADAQVAAEMQAALCGCLLAGANMIYHAAGWLEGGLTFSQEKFLLDIEVLQRVAEVFLPVEPDRDAFAAIAEIPPGGHFFAASHTMARYETAFAAPLTADWSNYGQWQDAGGRCVTERARDLWQKILAEFEAPTLDPARAEALDAFVARRRAEGSAEPMD